MGELCSIFHAWRFQCDRENANGPRMIWIIFAALTGVAVFSILWPLSRSAPQPREDAADVAFYRSQIAEIDAELARGGLDEEQARTAKALAARRLLAAAPDEVALEDKPRLRKIAAAVALVLVPAVALGLYARVGRPDLEDLPLEARLKAAPADMDLVVAVAKIEAHLAAHPEDGRAYEVVAPVYLRMGRIDDAVQARKKALETLGETPERDVRYAEALSYASDGVVSPDAEIYIDRALKLDPKFMEARYFQGLAAAQHDEKESARAIWSSMMAELPEGSKVRAAVAEKIAMLDAPEEPAQTAPSAAQQAEPQAADPQQQMIAAMVARLANRLATQGGNAEEWGRLIRAYKVLNDSDKARVALADARKALAGDAAGLSQITAVAQELGLQEK
jgi:cytochrome c-type biogenesis protein CcmH